MKRTTLLLIFILGYVTCQAQSYPKEIKPVKNVILMIPDGTSIGVVSAARWYKFYTEQNNSLHLDPYLCGTVQTYSSNAPIGDSAPTTSCYMTGVPQQTGNVAIYPISDPDNDLYPVDPAMAYQPLVTILEAARIELNKAVGMVVTCEFPQATPADCASHYYNRSQYKYLAPQMAHNYLDVMFAGGNNILTDDIKGHFKSNGTTLIQDDLQAFRNFNGDNKVWALFGNIYPPYDIDRDPDKVPALKEMTEKALEHLSKNDNGFFLMVEGSKIDWAAHDNDPVGCITEFLAFDEAVGTVMDFAKKNGETAVIILPDHGNSGFTIGKAGMKQKYDKATITDLFGTVSKIKRTGVGLEEILLAEKPENFKPLFKQYADIDITDNEQEMLVSSKNYKPKEYTKNQGAKNMKYVINDIVNKRMSFGFTTGGHTGEEVFLAAYHPQGDIPLGMNTNIEINAYLFDVLGMQTSLPDLTKRIFAKHDEVFSGLKYSIDDSSDFPVLTVKKGKKTLIIPAFKSIAYLNNKPIDLGSVTVYIDKNETFYLPYWLADQIR